MGLLDFLRRFFARGWFGSRSEMEDFIRRIERGDVQYILEIGVPTIEAPPTPGPRPWKIKYVAEGFESGSILLEDPEALMYILRATERRGEPLEIRGGIGDVLRAVADYTRSRPGEIYYFDGYSGTIEVRLLASNGLVGGIFATTGTGSYRGVRAVNRLAGWQFDPLYLWATRVKPRLIEWSDEELSVYVRGLDNQHKYLVSTLNSLYHATVVGEGERVIETILERLVDYTKFHFRSEEILMEKYSYPVDKLEHHRREHNSFVYAVTRFREKYEAGEEQLTVDVFKFLATWVARHVAGTDRDYGIYFKSIGVV